MEFGKYQNQEVSAKSGVVKSLLEVCWRRLLDLKPADRGAIGTVIEASLDKVLATT
jgi:hypothetical protein